ncbi:MAG: aldehyde dehydrogenase family protein [Gammaproteobacteria bacterium]|nr:aldehyde dehydrogenase family protein [Gammaproteobacteria bacterium]
MSYRLTYTTMFDPPPELHDRFDAGLEKVHRRLDATWDQYLDGQRVPAREYALTATPIDRELSLGRFAVASAHDVDAAVSAARRAFSGWRGTPPADRCRILRRACALIEERVYEIAAAVALEVGKNRMEALGEVQETADFFSGYCDEFERRQGFDYILPDDPLSGFRSHNRSVMKPHGVWAVITPFNYPFALAGGPVAAALVTGNTVVLKGSEETPWAGHLLADCLHDAGIPPGVFNYLCGPGESVGAGLAAHPQVAGITFTGSREVGMQLLARFTGGEFPRPCIAEMGGKNAVIVVPGADLERAATGIVRSAFGMGGQKCSALSRIYVVDPLADGLIQKIVAQAQAISIGDPTRRENWLGPVISASARDAYRSHVGALQHAGAILHCGGRVLEEGMLARGFYCAPTLAEAELSHPLWSRELFVPIVLLARVPDKEAAMSLANGLPFGLTAGFYGAQQDVPWFLENIEAGVTYMNRPQGATTGAWPGYQPFGGWKGSGSTGKAIASFYYLAQYLREQSQTIVE